MEIYVCMLKSNIILSKRIQFIYEQNTQPRSSELLLATILVMLISIFLHYFPSISYLNAINQVVVLEVALYVLMKIGDYQCG